MGSEVVHCPPGSVFLVVQLTPTSFSATQLKKKTEAVAEHDEWGLPGGGPQAAGKRHSQPF